MTGSTSLFTVLTGFFSLHGGDILSKMTASAGYDILKRNLDFKGLGGKIKGFFSKDEQAEAFIREVCNRQVPIAVSPQEALTTAYTDITGESIPEGLQQQLKEWFTANSDKIAKVYNISLTNTSGINVGVQKAKGNIYNIQGDYNAANGKKEDNQ